MTEIVKAAGDVQPLGYALIAFCDGVRRERCDMILRSSSERLQGSVQFRSYADHSVALGGLGCLDMMLPIIAANDCLIDGDVSRMDVCPGKTA